MNPVRPSCVWRAFGEFRIKPHSRVVATASEASTSARLFWKRLQDDDRRCPDGVYSSDTGTVVTLFAVPKIGSRLAGWTGACTGSKLYCIVTMNASKNVVAQFVRAR